MRFHSFLFCAFVFYSCGGFSGREITDDIETIPDGNALYLENCAACHGRDGTLRKAGSRDLSEINLNFDELKEVIEHGTQNGMPRFKEILKTDDNVEAVATHVMSFRRISQIKQ